MDFFKNLSGKDWAAVVSFGVACTAVGFGVKVLVDKKVFGGVVNISNRKNEAKVVDTVDIEDIGSKAVFCRCWRSKKFPYCDGSHGAHNTDTGDNVGPLIVKKKE